MGQDDIDTPYYVSYSGRLVSVRKGKVTLMAGSKQSGGYVEVNLRLRSPTRRWQVVLHKLVATAFVKGYDSDRRGFTIDHVDRDPVNNSANNLRFVPHSTNLRNRDFTPRGKRSPEDQARVRHLHSEGRTQREISDMTGVSMSSVRNFTRGSRKNRRK